MRTNTTMYNLYIILKIFAEKPKVLNQADYI